MKTAPEIGFGGSSDSILRKENAYLASWPLLCLVHSFGGLWFGLASLYKCSDWHVRECRVFYLGLSFHWRILKVH